MGEIGQCRHPWEHSNEYGMFVGSVKTKRGADLIFEIKGERVSLAQKYWWKISSKPSSRETGDEMAATKVPGDAEAAVESDSDDK